MKMISSAAALLLLAIGVHGVGPDKPEKVNWYVRFHRMKQRARQLTHPVTGFSYPPLSRRRITEGLTRFSAQIHKAQDKVQNTWLLKRSFRKEMQTNLERCFKNLFGFWMYPLVGSFSSKKFQPLDPIYAAKLASVKAEGAKLRDDYKKNLKPVEDAIEDCEAQLTHGRFESQHVKDTMAALKHRTKQQKAFEKKLYGLYGSGILAQAVKEREDAQRRRELLKRRKTVEVGGPSLKTLQGQKRAIVAKYNRMLKVKEKSWKSELKALRDSIFKPLRTAFCRQMGIDEKKFHHLPRSAVHAERIRSGSVATDVHDGHRAPPASEAGDLVRDERSLSDASIRTDPMPFPNVAELPEVPAAPQPSGPFWKHDDTASVAHSVRTVESRDWSMGRGRAPTSSSGRGPRTYRTGSTASSYRSRSGTRSS